MTVIYPVPIYPLDNKEPVFRFVIAFHIFLGFGVLMKGPAVVINVLFPLAVYVLYSRRWCDVKWFLKNMTAQIAPLTIKLHI